MFADKISECDEMTLNEGINIFKNCNYVKKNQSLHKNIIATRQHKPQLDGINESLRVFNKLGTICKRIYLD